MIKIECVGRVAGRVLKMIVNTEIGLGAYIMAISIFSTVACAAFCMTAEVVSRVYTRIDRTTRQKYPNHDGFMNKLMAMDDAKRRLEKIDGFLMSPLELSLDDIIALRKERKYVVAKMNKYVKKLEGHPCQPIVASIRAAKNWDF